MCGSLRRAKPTQVHDIMDCSDVFFFFSLPWISPFSSIILTLYPQTSLSIYLMILLINFLWFLSLSLSLLSFSLTLLSLFSSVSLPFCLSVHSCIWHWKRELDSLVLANGSRLVSLCKYLHRGIIDGPTHSRWSPTLLQATLGQRMALSVALTQHVRRWCDMTKHRIKHGAELFWCMKCGYWSHFFLSLSFLNRHRAVTSLSNM